MSAKAPAGSDNRNMGKMLAACTRATIAGEVESDVMSQAAPTLCIKVPILETRVASHKARNTGCCKGLQDEVAAGGGFMAWSAQFLSIYEKYDKNRGSRSESTAQRYCSQYNHRLGLVMPASFLPGPGGEKIGEPPPARPRARSGLMHCHSGNLGTSGVRTRKRWLEKLWERWGRGPREEQTPCGWRRIRLAQDGLQVRIRGGDGFDVEVFHQDVQDVGGDEGRAGSAPGGYP